jgi:hypothetical protein
MLQRPKLDGKKVIGEVKQDALKPGERVIKDLSIEELRDAFINIVRNIEKTQGAIQRGQEFLQKLQAEYNGVNAELAAREKKAG